MDVRNVFTSRLTQLRGKRSRNSVANEMGINPETLKRYEKGERLPSIDIAADIAKFYGVSVDWLLGIENHNSSKKEFVCMVANYTGLSEKSAELLHKYHNPPSILDAMTIDILNDLIESEKWINIGAELIMLENYTKKLMNTDSLSPKTAKEYSHTFDKADIAKLHCKELFDDLANAYDLRRSDREKYYGMKDQALRIVEEQLGLNE